MRWPPADYQSRFTLLVTGSICSCMSCWQPVQRVVARLYLRLQQGTAQVAAANLGTCRHRDMTPGLVNASRHYIQSSDTACAARISCWARTGLPILLNGSALPGMPGSPPQYSRIGQQYRVCAMSHWQSSGDDASPAMRLQHCQELAIMGA